MLHKIKWLSLSLILALLILLVAQNTGITTIRFLGWEMEAPRMILISAIGLAGYIAGVLTILLVQKRRRH